jgi:hypothetical protein
MLAVLTTEKLINKEIKKGHTIARETTVLFLSWGVGTGE